MNKEIEEMANEIDKADFYARGEMIAKSLYNAGYRKQPFKMTVKAIRGCEVFTFPFDTQEATYVVSMEEAQKQAIKEFAEKLKDKFNGYEATSYNGYEEGWHDLQEEIEELLKEYGIGEE